MKTKTNPVSGCISVSLGGVGFLSLVAAAITEVHARSRFTLPLVSSTYLVVFGLIHLVMTFFAKKIPATIVSRYLVVLSLGIALFAQLSWGYWVPITLLLYGFTGLLVLHLLEHDRARLMLIGITVQCIAIMGLQIQGILPMPTHQYQSDWIDLAFYASFLTILVTIGFTWKSQQERLVENLEESLENYRKAAQEQMKMQYLTHNSFAAVGKIAATLVHDLANTMQYGMFSREKPKEAAYSCLKKVAKMLRSSQEHLYGEPVHEKFCITSELREIVSFYQKSFLEHGVVLETSFHNPRYYWGDRMLFQQCVGNLLINAFEALLRTNQAKKSIRVITTNHHDKTIIAVSDNGPGIPPDHKSHIFEPFFSTKQTGKKRGIGLSMAKEYLDHLFQADLSFRSSQSRGTTFEIAFPKTGGRDAPKLSRSSKQHLRSPSF